jgi:hypothetical protein
VTATVAAMVETFEGRTFDWTSRHDPRSLAYPIRTLLPTRRPARRLWAPGPVLDQGREGACVGFAWVNEATASPVRVDLTTAMLPGHQGDATGTAWPRNPYALAPAVYRAAQRIDEWEGESYEGTSVLAGVKVMRSLGLVHEFRWAFGVDDVVATILGFGPVVLGIPWYESFYRAPGGELAVLGEVVGGHAILANGFDPAREVNGRPPRPMVHLQNSWGVRFGIDGGAWISVDDLAHVLRQDGEACVPTRRSYGRESTLRRLWNRLLGRTAPSEGLVRP